MGIGDKGGSALVDHVLSGFAAEERRQLPDFVSKGAGVVSRLLHEDVERVMNDINVRMKKETQQPREAGQESKNERDQNSTL